jgi:hypothetical protein
MTVREFISQLQDALDRAEARKVPNKEIIAKFIAPSSGFCGPTIRPKFLGDTDGADGRYGLTRLHVERLLEAFDVTLPPERGVV